MRCVLVSQDGKAVEDRSGYSDGASVFTTAHLSYHAVSPEPTQPVSDTKFDMKAPIIVIAAALAAIVIVGVIAVRSKKKPGQ